MPSTNNIKAQECPKATAGNKDAESYNWPAQVIGIKYFANLVTIRAQMLQKTRLMLI
jgi:hypothetical protein